MYINLYLKKYNEGIPKFKFQFAVGGAHYATSECGTCICGNRGRPSWNF